ncbi:MAG: PAS domain-containing protein [Legionellaceae bacterium]|nr:PAS domain-containing protein [Legionellaceae bacterium]
MTSKAKILDLLKIVAPILPAPIYWEDTNSVILGGNEPVIKATGALYAEAYVGKTLFELYPQEMAEQIKRHNEEVMRTGKILSQEEVIKDISTGEIKYFTAIKAPLRDDDGNIIGIVGTSVDITAEKEAERLKLENEGRKAQLETQERFTKMANQVAHDIRSPLASLLMIVKACEEIPERERIALRAASTRISDIANNLLQQYHLDKQDSSFETEEKRPILLSATLLQLLTEKKFQYQDCSVEFDCQIDHSGQFAFISIEPSSFKRMVSNLINNAVDSFSGKPGLVTLKTDATNEWGHVIVADNGKGMTSVLIEKIMNNMAVTEDKVDGNGIGLTQVRETLARNEGTLSIHSKIGTGTEIKLKFPRVKAPLWVAEEVTLGRQDLVVILDDDHSIHGAWDSRFEAILKQAPEIKIYHFEIGQEALTFLKALSNDDIKRTILLTDFELLKQGLDGLNIVEKSNLSRSILVTSHYDNQDIQKRAYALGTKILPKQLASEIPIIFLETKDAVLSHIAQGQIGEFVHAILVDDDAEFAENVMCYSFDDSDVIIHFRSPEELKENLAKYPEKYLKTTKICLDNNFDMSDIKGVQLAQELHDMGYTNLYLISGDSFHRGELPEYLTVLAKGDVGKIKNW